MTSLRGPARAKPPPPAPLRQTRGRRRVCRQPRAATWPGAAGQVAALLLAGAPGSVQAHGFGQLYTLPVPVWLYLYGAAASLALSFAIIGLVVTQQHLRTEAQRRPIDHTRGARLIQHRGTLALLRALGLLALGLCIVAGFWGSSDPYRNLAMTLFWILFVLGYAYATALTGNSYALLNPWRTLCDGLARARPAGLAARLPARRPWRYGYWPAVGLYLGFVWFELFGGGRPADLAAALLGYTLLNIAGAALWGRRDWFRHAEFFSVMFTLIGRMAPLTRRTDRPGLALAWRPPLLGLLRPPAAQWSLLVFVLCMLAATAFDGIKSTLPYVRLYWEGLAGLLAPWLPDNAVARTRLLRELYPYWQSLMLLLAPALYLAVYLLFIQLTRWVTRSRMGLGEMALRFALTLVPIAFVYSVSHYFTLIVTQGAQIFSLLSDPLGRGWDLFGTAAYKPRWLPDPGAVWHIQVGLILLGHIASVYLAHLEALRIFGSQRRAALSQLPMLLLMVALTTAGLWILSLPISPRAG